MIYRKKLKKLLQKKLPDIIGMDIMDSLANTIASFNTMNYFSRFLTLLQNNLPYVIKPFWLPGLFQPLFILLAFGLAIPSLLLPLLTWFMVLSTVDTLSFLYLSLCLLFYLNKLSTPANLQEVMCFPSCVFIKVTFHLPVIKTKFITILALIV